MTVKTKAPEAGARELLSDLQRFIEALDRRVPRPERGAESGIAREAAELRERAVRLMHEIEGDTPEKRLG